MRWAALFLLACGTPAAPVATATTAQPSVTASAPATPTVFRGIEHPRFFSMDAGRLWIFGAGLTPTATAKLPIGGTLHVHFAACEFDQTTSVERGQCKALSRAAFEKLEPGDDSPLRWKFWQWARTRMTVVDAPVDPAVAQTYARAHLAHESPKIPDLIVTTEKTTTLVEERITMGGGSGAMPITRATGRQVRHVERVGGLTYDTNSLMPSITEAAYPAATSLVGSGATWANARLIVVDSADDPHGPLASALRAAYVRETERAKTLAMLESTVQDDRDVRMAFIVDRVVLAWWLRDAEALRRATIALDAELARGAPSVPEVKLDAESLVPTLHRLRDDPSVTWTLPAGIEAWQ